MDEHHIDDIINRRIYLRVRALDRLRFDASTHKRLDPRSFKRVMDKRTPTQSPSENQQSTSYYYLKLLLRNPVSDFTALPDHKPRIVL